MDAVGAKPECGFSVGGIKHVVCMRLQVPGFGSRYVPYLREDGSDRYLGITRSRRGLRSYSDFGRMMDWLDRRYQYRDHISVFPSSHNDASRLGLVTP